MTWFSCWRCRGAGTVTAYGDPIPHDQLTPSQYGEWLAMGTRFYRARAEPCRRCSGSTRR